MRRRTDLRFRRRRRALAAVAVIAFAAGMVAAARHDDGGRPRGPVGGSAAAPESLPLERQVGELLVLAFPGTTAPAYVGDALRGGRASGVILFARNAASAEGTRRLTRDLQRAAGGRALVAVDQEGGPIRSLAFAAPSAGQPALGRPARARAAAAGAAHGLGSLGVNVNLAPVADAALAGTVMAGRAFPGDAAQVAALTRASVEGYRGAAVAPTLKHFPGLGRASANTDDAPVTIPAGRGELRGDLAAFRAGIDAGAPLVMASHALYPALDGRRIASQSPSILRSLLRGRLGFRGVVITDSLEADAVLGRSGVERAAVRSLRAGADLLLMTGPGSFPTVRRAILRAARRSPALRRRVAEAAARVLELKRRLALPVPHEVAPSAAATDTD